MRAMTALRTAFEKRSATLFSKPNALGNSSLRAYPAQPVDLNEWATVEP